MRELESFPECDGHIESILIGCRVVKVSFQTWNANKLVLVYEDVESVKEQNAVFGDISEYAFKETNAGFIQYSFFGSNDHLVLNILAKSVRVFEVGENADINSALFDVGYEYIGGQSQES